MEADFQSETIIIFDMDGTVLDTLEDLSVSVNYALEKFHLPPRMPEEYRHFFGNGVRHAIRLAAPDGTPEDVIDGVMEVYREHYNKHCLDHTRPYDGILELMSELKSREFKLAIVSNKIDSAVKELHQRFFSDYVDIALGEKDGIRRKPEPDMVRAVVDELAGKEAKIIYVGDSEVDCQTAKNAGIPCISVLWGFRDKDCLIDAGATLFADKPMDVLELILKERI